VPGAAVAAAQPATPSAEASPGELNARFLFSAYQTRLALKEMGPAERTLAENLWTLATEFSEIVRRAEPQQQDLYVPLLQSFQTTLQQQVLGVDSPDLVATSRLRGLLHEQVEINRALGAQPGSSASVTATVRAITNGVPRNGFYVWLDSPSWVPQGRSANALPGMTNQATKRITRATYLVRIVNQRGDVVGSRELFIGQGMTPSERVDVLIPASAQ
jgi:hypothetical protein